MNSDQGKTSTFLAAVFIFSLFLLVLIYRLTILIIVVGSLCISTYWLLRFCGVDTPKLASHVFIGWVVALYIGHSLFEYYKKRRFQRLLKVRSKVSIEKIKWPIVMVFPICYEQLFINLEDFNIQILALSPTKKSPKKPISASWSQMDLEIYYLHRTVPLTFADDIDPKLYAFLLTPKCKSMIDITFAAHRLKKIKETIGFGGTWQEALTLWYADQHEDIALFFKQNGQMESDLLLKPEGVFPREEFISLCESLTFPAV